MCPTGLVQIDNDGTVRMLNPMVSKLLMPVAPGGVTTNLFDVLQRCAPDLRNMVSSYPLPRGKICDNHRLFIGDFDGHPRVLSCTMLRVDPSCVMVMLNDISELVAQERRLKQTDAWLTTMFSNGTDFAYFTLDSAGLIDCWSPSGLLLTGYSAADVLGHTPDVFQPAAERVNGQTLDLLACARREGFYLYEGRCVTRDQVNVWWQILITAVKEDDGSVSGFTVVLRDVTQRKMTSDELRRLLTTDQLTGAANRTHFFERAQAEVTRWQRHAQLSVIMMDADHFKQVNDKFAHETGDFVLQTP
jgi:PAS domain S-box-containing protein